MTEQTSEQISEDILDEILDQREGGQFTDRADDRGGPTKWGVTLQAWREFTGRPGATVTELQGLTRDQAREFYLQVHIKRPRFDAIADPLLRDLVVDAGVHHGVGTATIWIQRAAATVSVDGDFGPLSQAAVNAPNVTAAVFLDFLALRIRKFGFIVTRDPVLAAARKAGFALQASNAEGWNNRAANFLEEAAEQVRPTRAIK